MSRTKREFSELPTEKLRIKLWCRYVLRELLPTHEAGKSCAHLINDAVADASRNNKAALKIINEQWSDGEEIISKGRWTDWWKGANCPQPNKLELLNLVVPGSSRWFVSSSDASALVLGRNIKAEGSLAKHPILTLLHAFDVWAQRGKASEKALLLSKNIADVWGPRPHIDKVGIGGKLVTGWYAGPAKCDLRNMKILDRYRVLEPPSIVTFLLWFGYEYNVQDMEEDIFRCWTFDLLSASLATAKIINDDSCPEAYAVGGDSADTAALVRSLWLLNLEKIVRPVQADSKDTIKSRIRNLYNSEALPSHDDARFVNFLFLACQAFYSELEAFGVKFDDLQELRKLSRRP